HLDAGKLYEKAATCYKLAKSWDQAGAAYVKSAQCHLKSFEGDNRHSLLGGLSTFGCAAIAYKEAAHAYKNTNTKEFIACLEQASNLFIEIEWLSRSADHCKEIAELYEQEQNLEQAISYYHKAANLFQCEELHYFANQCKQKIAQFSAHLEQAIVYWVKTGRVGPALICEIVNKPRELDPKFSATCEYRLLADLAAALDEVDVVKFTDAVKEFNSMTKLDKWNTALLLRVELLLKAKEEEDDDRT
uniref:alpha-soluble NSF attachment protein-like n=1 Tax=Erigeron canadensis TaxID=72917 RepID=UPI001CB95883